MFAGPLGRSTFTPPKSSFDSPLYGLVSLRRSQPADVGTKRLDVMLAVREHNLQNSVRRGENAGKQLKHQSVVRRLGRVGTIDPRKEQTTSIEVSVELDPAWNRKQLQAVVFLQERNTRRIVGAAVEDLAVRE